MKRIVLLILMAAIIPLDMVSAAIIVPTANLTIVVNTEGDDGPFHFDLRILAGAVFEDYQDFDLSTENRTTRTQVELAIFGNSSYLLVQRISDGLKINVDCFSDNPNDNFSYQDNRVRINPKTGSNVVCIFNNKPEKLKTPVLIIPGIMGSELYEGGDLIWPAVSAIIRSFSDDFLSESLALDENGISANSIKVGNIIKTINLPFGT